MPATASDLCNAGGKMRVHVYDVGQATAVLVDLPDGHHVLIDTGDAPRRARCGQVCANAHDHLVAKLDGDLHGDPLDLLWISHQHSDHVGGAPGIMARFAPKLFVDNGRDLEKKEIELAHGAAERAGTKLAVVDPDHRKLAMIGSDSVKFTPIVPAAWPSRCKANANDCSILLRLDYCASSVLFTGDAEEEEERVVDVGGPVTLMIVGHHGSNTSSGEAFLEKLAPKYAVISAGKPHEGLNKGYCHPRASTVKRLTEHLGGAGSKAIRSYSADKCDEANEGSWQDVPASDRLWATERDGDVVLVTNGDGSFAKE